ncbi:MAG TPA: lipoate--protein ligase family protein [Candidatus Obscuribacterales bacterium]
MAIDEAILEAHLMGKVPPTLRFYGWEPPAVSLGYAQKLPTESVNRIHEMGFDIVKRPTGGRAVLHFGELTYSFVGSTDAQLRESILDAYKQICSGLLEGLRLLGVELEIGSGQPAHRQMHDCFLATTTADLHFGGKKMVGSAQLRRKHAVLQHGSILLSQPQDLMPKLLYPVTAAESAASLKRHANLFEILKREPTYKELQAAFHKGFEKAFATRFEPGELTELESQLATALLQNKPGETIPV